MILCRVCQKCAMEKAVVGKLELYFLIKESYAET